MREFKVFLGSSEELADDRLTFSRVMEALGRLTLDQGVLLTPIKWETLDYAMAKEGKQPSYNAVIETCDVALLLFAGHYGCYTVSELETALAHERATGAPQTFVWERPADVPNEREQELAELLDGHSPLGPLDACHYQTLDDLSWDLSERVLEALASRLGVRLRLTLRGEVLLAGRSRLLTLDALTDGRAQRVRASALVEA